MTWEFEHWNDGKVYLHQENWQKFKENFEKTGNGYFHNQIHQRIYFKLTNPRNSIFDIPVEGPENIKYELDKIDNKWQVFGVFPAFEDPYNQEESFNCFAEDNINGIWSQKIKYPETISLMKSKKYYSNHNKYSLLLSNEKWNEFAFFRDKIWKLTNFREYGLGPYPVSNSEFSRKTKYRDISEE